jgi:hypothetical protein
VFLNAFLRTQGFCESLLGVSVIADKLGRFVYSLNPCYHLAYTYMYNNIKLRILGNIKNYMASRNGIILKETGAQLQKV